VVVNTGLTVYVSGKNNKILPIPETMQGISTRAESKRKKGAKKTKKKKPF
jgi:hypothetical protein